jgi:hypothetical protein
LYSLCIEFLNAIGFIFPFYVDFVIPLLPIRRLPDLTVRVTRRMSYKKQELFTLSRAPGSTPCFGVLLVFCVVFLFVLIIFLVYTMLQVSLECQFWIGPSITFIIFA